VVAVGATAEYECLTGTHDHAHWMVHCCRAVLQRGCIWRGYPDWGCVDTVFLAQKKIEQVLEHMMRILVLVVLLMTVCDVAAADARVLNKPVLCDATTTVLNTLVNQYGETPQWQGTNTQQGTRFVLTVNLKTGEWSLVELNGVTACVIGVGENASSAWGTPVRHTQ